MSDLTGLEEHDALLCVPQGVLSAEKKKNEPDKKK